MYRLWKYAEDVARHLLAKNKIILKTKTQFFSEVAKLQFGVINMELMSILNVLTVASTLTNVMAGKVF